MVCTKKPPHFIANAHARLKRSLWLSKQFLLAFCAVHFSAIHCMSSRLASWTHRHTRMYTKGNYCNPCCERTCRCMYVLSPTYTRQHCCWKQSCRKHPMYGHDGASNNVAPNRHWFYSEQHCCWPHHDHILGVSGNFVSSNNVA